jgi:hypothetical protein
MARDCETAVTPRRSPTRHEPSSPLRRCLVYLSHLRLSLPAGSTRRSAHLQLFFLILSSALGASGIPVVRGRLSPALRIHIDRPRGSRTSSRRWIASCGPCVAASAGRRDSLVNFRRASSCIAREGRRLSSVGGNLSCLSSTLAPTGRGFCYGRMRSLSIAAVGMDGFYLAVPLPSLASLLHRSRRSHNVLAPTEVEA